MTKLPENTEFEGAVGALVTVEVDGKKCAILQKRAVDDSFPGCLQVTVHGGLEKTGKKAKEGVNRSERESMIVALRREVSEEVLEMIQRSDFYRSPSEEEDIDERDALLAAATKTDDLDIEGATILAISRKTKLPQKDGDKPVKKTDVTLGFRLSQINENLGLAIRQLQHDGVIVLLSADELDKLIPINPKLHKKEGVKEEGKFGMFQDEIDAVKNALSISAYVSPHDWRKYPPVERITENEMRKLWVGEKR